MKAVQVTTTYREGYGTPSSWEVRAICDNRELERLRCYSGVEAGVAAERMRTKWQRRARQDDFSKRLAKAPLASAVCSVCGGDTLDGVISVADKTFCMRCKDQIPKFKAEYADRQRVLQERFAEERRQQDSQRLKETKKVRQGFHWRDGWYFSRLVDGAVQIDHVAQVGQENSHVDRRLTIPAGEWASIVASVSAGGEVDGRWQTALDFHAANPAISSQIAGDK